MDHITDFRSTESSIVFSVHSNKSNPFSAEIHVHFGKYNIVHITAVVTSDKVLASQGTDFLEALLIEAGYKLCSYFGLLKRNVELEIYLTVFYFGIRIAHLPVLGSTELRGLASYTRELVEENIANLTTTGPV